MPELYDSPARQHIPMLEPAARMPGTDPGRQTSRPPWELGYDATPAVAESTRMPHCNTTSGFDRSGCVAVRAAPTSARRGYIHMVDVNQIKTGGLLPGN